MTTLGQAYVQIMPSAKGISGSIQKTLNPEATAAGKSAGSRIASSISDSMGKAGKTLTKAITVPALGAATAVAGVVSALGFKRLIGMDNAQAKLKGLGVEGKQLEVVMESVKGAVTGTTHTMADGADVAAGALAAGVTEGAELERYIKLVGDAATGANAPMGEMAQIFNRVQGTGKLTRHELNQIEHRLPGFSQAMAKHVGADSLEAFYDMVSAGEVGTNEFLNVMDDFAGGMSEAYAGTWSGLKDNVLANIGIIGEALLEGLFEDGKKGMAEFLDFLRNSEGLKEWATETGEKLREVFQKIVETVKDAINWWTELDDGTKKLITTMAGIAIAIGPVLMVISKMITTALTLAKGFAMLKTAAVFVGGAIGAISAPVWGIIAGIAALVAAGVLLWNNWDTIKEKAIELKDLVVEKFVELKENTTEKISELVESVVEKLTEFKDRLVEKLIEIKDSIVGFFTETIPQTFNDFISFMQEVPGIIMEFLTKLFIEDIPYVIGFGIGWMILSISEGIIAVIEFFQELPGRVLEFLLETISNITEWATNMKKRATETGTEFLANVVKFIKELPGRVATFLSNAISRVATWSSNMKTRATEAGSTFLNNVINFIKNLPGRIATFLTNAISRVTEFASNMKNKAKEAGKNAYDSIIDEVKKIPGRLKSLGSDIISGLVRGVTGSIGKVASIAKDIASSFVGGFKKAMGIKSPSVIMRELGNFVTEGLGLGIEDMEEYAEDKVLSVAQSITGTMRDGIELPDMRSGTISVGINNDATEAQKVIDNMLDFDLTKKARFSNANASNLDNGNNVVNLLVELIEAVKDGHDIIVDGDVLGSTVDRRFVNQEGIESYFRGDR